jgi:hypothetical protein
MMRTCRESPVSFSSKITDSRNKCIVDQRALANLVPTWFYLIATHFMGRTDDESLWGGEIGAHLLSHIIRTLSCIVSVGKFSSAIDLIAMDFLRLVWCFKDAETPEIRASVADAVRAIVHVVSEGMKVKLLSDNSVDSLLHYLTMAMEVDPDEVCRSSAAAAIMEAMRILEESDLLVIREMQPSS